MRIISSSSGVASTLKEATIAASVSSSLIVGEVGEVLCDVVVLVEVGVDADCL